MKRAKVDLSLIIGGVIFVHLRVKKWLSLSDLRAHYQKLLRFLVMHLKSLIGAIWCRTIIQVAHLQVTNMSVIEREMHARPNDNILDSIQYTQHMCHKSCSTLVGALPMGTFRVRQRKAALSRKHIFIHKSHNQSLRSLHMEGSSRKAKQRKVASPNY